MQGFASIVGHTTIIDHLQQAIRLKKVSHAYIFSGESGMGKRTLADAFAASLQCEKEGIDARITSYNVCYTKLLRLRCSHELSHIIFIKYKFHEDTPSVYSRILLIIKKINCI